MTTITIQLTNDRFTFIKRQLKDGGYKDINQIFSRMIDREREIQAINQVMERNVRAYLDKDEKPPVPYADRLDEAESLLDEVEDEPVDMTAAEWANINAEITAQYQARKNRRKTS